MTGEQREAVYGSNLVGAVYAFSIKKSYEVKGFVGSMDRKVEDK